MTDIFKKLSTASKISASEYMKVYMSNVKEIFPLTVSDKYLKSHIKADEISSAESLLRFSLVFNDLSLVTCISGKELAMSWLQEKWFEDNFGVSSATITLSETQLKKMGVALENLAINPAFVFPSGEEANALAKKLYPFIEREKLLLQPERSLFYESRKTVEGSRAWESINVEQFTPIEQWEIIDEVSSRPLPLQFDSLDSKHSKTMFEITIPYLEGVSFDDLAKILDDEGDLISSLKLSIKAALDEIEDDVDPVAVAKDIIDPKVDMLNRKFKSTINSHAFKVAGAAVGTAVLAYTSVSTAGVSSAIATVCGSGGIGLLGKEYSSYRDNVNKIKDDPYYFLWKCRKLSKKT